MKWISIKEGLPQEDINVLFQCNGNDYSHFGPGTHSKDIYYGKFFKKREIIFGGDRQIQENVFIESNPCDHDGEHDDISLWAEIEPPKDEE